MREIAKKYHWLKYDQVPFPEAHLWIVLRWYQEQYVVHMYNSQDNGHYFGQYFGQDLEKAEIAYQKKIKSYRQINYPSNLMEVLEIIRVNGVCNMYDLDCICSILKKSSYQFLADYLISNRHNYHKILEDFAEWKANQPKNEPKSLAQQLAEEMGWQVIVD